MNNNDYQDMPCISSHWLIDMLQSPAHCYRRHLDPARAIEAPSDALRLGTLVHCLALTPKQFTQEFRVIAQDRRSRAGRAEWDWTTAQGWAPIRPGELDRARAIVAALKADPTARKLLAHGKKERTIIQPRQAGLLPLKARLDIHDEARRHVIELKTTWNLLAMVTAWEKYRYALSAAFYRDMVRGQHTTFIFVETKEPYNIAIEAISKEDLQDGERQWRTALELFDACWKLNQWPEMESTTPIEDEDPLMLPGTPLFHRARPRCELPVGELTL